MKRLDPATNKPFKYKAVREDGRLFLFYSKTLRDDGFFVEHWISPEKMQIREDRARRRFLKWREDNAERHRCNVSKWEKENPHKVTAKSAKRRSSKMQRTPNWLTKEQYIEIESVYAQAKQLTDTTGIPHHVDHIVPLQGKKVSGLHVPWNLQILTADQNLRKSNKATE